MDPRLVTRLLAERTSAGHWEGELSSSPLSSSPLSTATAVSALTLVGGHDGLVQNGVRWLRAHQNDDGGFGDADRNASVVAIFSL